jgi:hypothetical protein
MGLFIKLLLLLVIMALAAPFVLKGPDGQPLMTLDDIGKPDSLSGLADSIGQQVSNPFADEAHKATSSKEQKSQVYSWRDEQGNVHYSNIAPKESASVKTIRLDPNRNIIKMDKPDGEAAATQMPMQEPEQADGPSVIQVYTPEGMNHLKREAEAARDKLQSRSAQSQ